MDVQVQHVRVSSKTDLSTLGHYGCRGGPRNAFCPHAEAQINFKNQNFIINLPGLSAMMPDVDSFATW
jgi:hypothetical protein